MILWCSFFLQVNWVVRDWWVFRCNGIAINYRKSFAASPSTALKLLSEITLTEFLPVLFITNFALFFAFLLLQREKLKPRELLQLNCLLKVTTFPNTQQHWRYLVEPDVAAAVQSFPDKLEFCGGAEKSAGTKAAEASEVPNSHYSCRGWENGAEFCRHFSVINDLYLFSGPGCFSCRQRGFSWLASSWLCSCFKCIQAGRKVSRIKHWFTRSRNKIMLDI